MTILYIGVALLVLLLMITIHELGHYFAGRALGFKINEFAIGFGKVLFSWKNKKGIKFSIRIFPLGGYCAFENAQEKDKKEEKKPEDVELAAIEEKMKQAEKKAEGLPFEEQPAWKRLIVLFSGALANFLSAIVFSFILLVSIGFDIPQVNNGTNIYNSTAIGMENPLQAGDVLYAIDGKKINFAGDGTFSQLIANYTGEKNAGDIIIVTVRRDGKKMDLEVPLYKRYSSSVLTRDEQGFIVLKPDTDFNAVETYVYDSDGNPLFAISSGLTNYRFSFVEALGECFMLTFRMCWYVLKALFMLITFQLPLSQLGGPIASIGAIADAASVSMANILILLPMFAANLAMFNLIPFPALDGMQMVFTAVEMIRRKPLNQKILGWINLCGLIFLIAFVIFTDIVYFFF